MSAFQNFIIKVKETAKNTWRHIRKTPDLVRGSNIVQTIITKVKQPVGQNIAAASKIAGARFGLSIAITLAFRLIKRRGKVKNLWTDRKNTHRRFVSVLWEALMLEAASLFFSLVFALSGPFFLAAFIVSLIVGAAVDITYRVYHGKNYAPWHTQIAYSGLMWTAKMVRMTLMDIPFGILRFEPKFIRDFVAPAYEAKVVVVEEVEEVVEVNTESVNDREPVEINKVTIEDREVEVEVEKVTFTIDGNEFGEDPKRAGENLARQMTQLSKGERRRYRKDLPKELRNAGLNAREVTLGLHGFDQALATV